MLCSIVAAGYALDRFLSFKRALAHATFWLWFLSLGSVSFVALESQVSMLPLLGLLGFVVFETRTDTPARERRWRSRWSSRISCCCGRVAPLEA